MHVDERKGKIRGREKSVELTLYLRAGKRTDCCLRWELTWMRQEGFELLGVVEGRRENRLQRASAELLGVPPFNGEEA